MAVEVVHNEPVGLHALLVDEPGDPGARRAAVIVEDDDTLP
jgi:hypothetical protein